MKKLISILMAALLVAGLFAGCVKKDDTVIRVTALKGPTGMGMAGILGDEYKDIYDITLSGAPDEVTASFISGETDVAAVPVNLASVLYNKLEGDVAVLAVTTLGVLYILENGTAVNALSDLSGKTLYATGQGSTPEYVVNYLLDRAGVENVTVEYLTEHSELAALMASGERSLGMLPEPNVTAVTAKNANVRVALDLTAEWDAVCDTPLVQGCLIARRSFVEEHGAAVERFLADYEASTAFVNEHHQRAAMVMEAHEILASAAIAKAAIPKCNIVYMTGDEMETALSAMLAVLFEANPKSVGGALPASDFYYAG